MLHQDDLRRHAAVAAKKYFDCNNCVCIDVMVAAIMRAVMVFEVT